MFEDERRTLNDLIGDQPAVNQTRNRIYASMRKAAAQSRAAFAAHLASLDPCDANDALHLIDLVEALSTEANGWTAELRQMFASAAAAAHNCPKAEWPARVLESFAYLEAPAPDVHDALLTDSIRLARNSSPRVRRAAIQLFGGFDIRRTPGLSNVVTELLRDPDWRTRRDAEALLADEHLTPEGYRPRLLDRLRRRVSRS